MINGNSIPPILMGGSSFTTHSDALIIETVQTVDGSLSDFDLHLGQRVSFGSYTSTTASEGESWVEEGVDEWPDFSNGSLLDEADCFAWPVDMQIDLGVWPAERSIRSFSGRLLKYNGYP